MGHQNAEHTSRDVGALVVAPEQEEVLGVLDLVAEQQQDGLETLLPSVHVIPKEEVVRRGREPTHLEQPDEVRVLPMHVTDNLDGWGELDKRGLAEEDLARSLADGDYLGVLETQRLAHFARVSDVQKPLYHVIDIELLDPLLGATCAHTGGVRERETVGRPGCGVAGRGGEDGVCDGDV